MGDNLSLNDAIKQLITVKGQKVGKKDKEKISKAVDLIHNVSENGLPSNIIKIIAETFVFTDHYDINIRRKLLYCLVPESRDFNYAIIPIAISYSASLGASPTLQNGTLIWLTGLLEYKIIDGSHKMVHVCYPSLFELLNSEKLCLIVCKILTRITKREDVTFHRTQVLLNLKKKLSICGPISYLLRVYHMYRPDLVAIDTRYSLREVPYNNSFRHKLLLARERVEMSEENSDFVDDGNMWPELMQAKSFVKRNAIPLPDVLTYADTIEEKKEQKISVLEYKRIKEMIRDIPKWRKWRWPNSPACLLWKPAAIPLFKPNEFNVKVAITDWLEIALRVEIIQQIAPENKTRQENLLDATVQFVKHNDTLIPVIYHFLVEFLLSWDQHSYLPQVLELLSNMPYTSPDVFFGSILVNFAQILSTCSPAVWCAIINAFANTAVNWALADDLKSLGTWPLQEERPSPIEGIFFLTKELELIFIAATLRFGATPLILNSIVSYYNKVNMVCYRLDLPFFIAPSPDITLLIITSGDLIAIHRTGIMLCDLKAVANKVKNMEPEGYDSLMQSVSLYQIEGVNVSIRFFLDSLITAGGFNESWKEMLRDYFNEPYLDQVLNVRNIQHFGLCGRAMVFSTLVAETVKKESLDINEISKILKITFSSASLYEEIL